MNAPIPIDPAPPLVARDHVPPHERRWAWAAALLAFALVCLYRWGSEDFCLDDAWIHLSYAKSLRAGDGWSYNPGDWETGTTSPLWVLLLAVWPIDIAPVLSVQLLGGLLHAVSAWTAAHVALLLAAARASVSRGVPLASVTALAGVLVATAPPLLHAAVSGMEVSLTTALLLGSIATQIAGRRSAAAGLAGMATLARPEAGFAIAVFACGRSLLRRSWSPLRPLVGVALAVTTWCTVNWILSGHVWPNTAYIKGGLTGASFSYVLEEVLVWEPWIVSLTGVVLAGWSIYMAARDRQYEPLLIMAGWLLTVMAIAASRELHVGVSFYERRYFVIVAALPGLVVALALIRLHRWLAVALLLPMVAAIGMQSESTYALLRAQERDVLLLHTVPARHVAEQLPAHARIAAEGAGSLRYWTPRTMTIIDIIGLNNNAIAHAPSPEERMCEVLRARPTHLVVPDNAVAPFRGVLELRPLRRFDDPAFHQVLPPHPVSVHLFEIVSVRERWRHRCSLARHDTESAVP